MMETTEDVLKSASIVFAALSRAHPSFVYAWQWTPLCAVYVIDEAAIDCQNELIRTCHRLRVLEKTF
jgi:hypothetical protein